MNTVMGLYNYWIVIFLMMTGFYIVIARSNLIQKIIGLNIFQISVFLLYITMGKIKGGQAPILLPPATPGGAHGSGHDVATAGGEAVAAAGHVADALEHAANEPVLYTHPLPSVLMLTAIVVGVATTSLGLALIVRIREAYGTIEEDEILLKDREAS